MDFLRDLVMGFVQGCLGIIDDEDDFELINCIFQIDGPIDADFDGRELGMLINFPENSGEVSNLNGVAYLVDNDGDGMIDAIKIDCREPLANFNTPAKVTQLIEIDTLINNSDSCSPQAKDLLNQLVTHSVMNGGEAYARAIPHSLLQKG